MYQPHAMLLCGRECYVVDAAAGTRCEDFSAFCFFLYSFLSIAGSIHRLLPQFFKDHTMSL